MVVSIHFLVGRRLDVTGEGTAVGRRQVSRAAVEGVRRINAGWLGGLLLGSLLLFIRGLGDCGGCISMGEFIDAWLGAMVTVHGAGGGQLRGRVDRPSVGNVLGESTAAYVSVFMATYVVVAVGGVLRGRIHQGYFTALKRKYSSYSVRFTLISDLSSSSSSRRSLCSVRDVPGDSLLFGA